MGATLKGDMMTTKPLSDESSEACEVRWAVIALEGQHSWLGRSEPTDDEMNKVRGLATAHKRPLWFARVEGEYYSHKPLIVTLWGYINTEFGGEGSFEAAVAAFEVRRNRVIADYAGGRGKDSFPEVIARRDPDRARSPHPQAP